MPWGLIIMLGDQTLFHMTRTTRVIISVVAGIGLQALLSAFCMVASRDFTHEGPDTPIAIFLSHAVLWPLQLLSWLNLAPAPQSGYMNIAYFLFAYCLPMVVYGILTHALLRSKKVSVA